MKSKKKDTRRFFHYTGYTGAVGILGSGRINCGCTPFDWKNKLAVCLTTDKSPDGHGLTEGEVVRLNDPNFPHVARSTKAPPGTTFVSCANLKNIRLTIEIEKTDPRLKSWAKVEKGFRQREKSPHEAENEDLLVLAFKHSASYPVGTDHLPTEQLRKELILTREGRFPEKSDTWWFYWGAIPSEWITRVERRVAGDEYVTLEGDSLAALAELAELENGPLVLPEDVEN